MTTSSSQRASLRPISSQPSSGSALKERSAFNALEHVTAEISALLARGVMAWRAPWDPGVAMAATPGLPLRVTGAPYRGANVVLLWAAQISRGYAKRTWLTFRQAIELGASVRKGEKACPVIYYGQAKSQASSKSASSDGAGADETSRPYRFLKLFHVFNADQIDGLPDGFGADAGLVAQPLTAVDAWINACGARVVVGGDRAYYSPSADCIHMPARSAFLSDEHECATRLHELVHFTGHASRLDRLSDYALDLKARAREELCAEMGAAILGAMLGLAPQHLEDHAAYIDHWLGLIRDEPRAFLSAGSRAQAAVDWLIAKAGHPIDEERERESS